MNDTTEIATSFTVGDYRRIRASLQSENFRAPEWHLVLSAFERRIKERFLRPIRQLAKDDNSLPFRPGAAILALDCLLIDTLASFREGRSSTNEISPARSFKNFLSSKRFSEFNNRDRSDFFSDVRNGLLHNGETRGNWKFRIDVPGLLHKDKSTNTRTINRRMFHARVLQEFRELCWVLKGTGGEAIRARDLFLRRMDALCGIEKSFLNKFYFAYGSNLVKSELLRTCPGAECVAKAFLPGYRLTFSKHSVTRQGDAANIEIDPCRMTWGFVYRMSDSDKEALGEREGGYREIAVEAFLIDGEDVTPQSAFTFVGEAICEKRCGPADEYLALVIQGAKSRDLPEKYCNEINLEFHPK